MTTSTWSAAGARRNRPRWKTALGFPRASGATMRVLCTDSVSQTAEQWDSDGGIRPFVYSQFKQAKLAKGQATTFQNLLTLVGSTLFGTTAYGGADGDGTIFSINTNGSGYQVLYSFSGSGSDGADPFAGLTLVGSTLFGTTAYGGADDDGTIFSINTDGSGYQVLYSFTNTGSDGADPYAALTLVGSTLFGTTAYGGADGAGTVFSINADGSGYQVLHSFSGTGSDGADPYAGLTLAGSTLFGTTAYGGAGGAGTVFSINADGSGYQVLYSFADTGSDGADPNSSLTLAGYTLFGTTAYGGADGSRHGLLDQYRRQRLSGSVFVHRHGQRRRGSLCRFDAGRLDSVRNDGVWRRGRRRHGLLDQYRWQRLSDPVFVHRFGHRRREPYAGLTLVGNTLYGTTWYGGADGDGTIFSIDTDGSGYQILYSFTGTGTDGSEPYAGLTLVGNTLYGTTWYGGADGDGTIFSINTDGSDYQVLYSFTGTGSDGPIPMPV